MSEFCVMRPMFKIVPILFFVISLFLGGCVKNNAIPVYLEVSKFKLLDNSTIAEGELTENITEGWVYINDKFVGIFELPCKVPVLFEGEALVVAVYPTVRMNGVSATKVQHPYLEPYFESANFVPGEQVSITPTTRYVDGTQFWIEDFQSGSIKLTNGTDNNATISQMIDPNNPNNIFGQVNLNSTQNNWSVYTADGLSFTIGSKVILEFDYCSTSKIITSVIAGKSDGTITDHIHYSAREQDPSTMVWKKFYVDITENVRLSGGYIFWQGFKARLTEGRSEDIVMIDNIKVVYR